MMTERSPQADLSHARSPISHDVTSFDSGSVFLIKSLFYPVTVVAFLALCLWLGHRPFSGRHFLIAVLAFAGAAELLGDSRIDHGEPAVQMEVRWFLDLFARWIGVGLFIALILYLSGMMIRADDDVLLTWFALTPLVLGVSTFGVRRLLVDVGINHIQERRAVIIGANQLGLLLQRRIEEQPLLRIKMLGFFEDLETGDAARPKESLVGRLADVPEFVRICNVNLVYITLPIAPDPRILQLLDGLRDTVASVYFVPDLHALNIVQSRVDVVHGMPMFSVYESPFFGVRSVAKVVSDFVLSSILLVCASPVFVAVAIAIKCSSKGPILFRQLRYGLDGREIMVYKFRSMTVTEDGASASTFTQVTRGDPRVTPVGAFIRRTSLDELPQLLNVLEGSMSLVGPRPHAIAVNEHYRRLIPSYMLRHKVKPGITGWAQVNGYRGGDDLPTMTKRIEHDLEYLKNWSLWFDLRIIARTVRVVFGDSRAY
jgi:putative colanic acid biosysnthesis UDP-glucose lipid carrier transferase